MKEPGLSRQEWETEWQALEPLVVDSPAEALPELDRLVGRMLVERGYPLEEGESERVAEEVSTVMCWRATGWRARSPRWSTRVLTSTRPSSGRR
jgi:hypothetical protein